MAEPTRQEALARTNKKRIIGNMTQAYKADDPGNNFCLDARDALLYYDQNDGTAAPISIGKGGKPQSPAVVGGRIEGRIPWDAEWQTVKSNWDAASLRLEGTGQLVSFDLRVKNMEDGFEPHPDVNPNGNLTNTFWLEGAYMEHIRDDAIENDQCMPGMIRDCYVEECNRFLSEQADSQNIHNPNGVVNIESCLVHMTANMPNNRAKDKKGYGGVFKWMGDAGKVAVKDSIFFLDEPPIAGDKWPQGTYQNVTVVLGPKYPGSGRPSYLPTTVIVTRDVQIWTARASKWRLAHNM